MTHEEDQVAGLLLAAGGGDGSAGGPRRCSNIGAPPRGVRGGGAARGRMHARPRGAGARADAVRERARLDGCVLVDNPEWENGMGSSLRAGLGSLAGTGARAALVSLVDQPGIGPRAVARVLAAHQDDTSLVSATYDGVRGHPVLFGAAHWAGVAASATGDRGHAPI